MVVHYKELITAAKLVAQNSEMRANLSCSLQGATLAGTLTFAGGLLLGPVGMLVGGTMGGFASWAFSRNQFKSVVSIIDEDMTAEQRILLAEHMRKAFEEFDVVHDVGPIIAFLAAPNSHIELSLLLKRMLEDFINQEFGIQVESNPCRGPVKYRVSM